MRVRKYAVLMAICACLGACSRVQEVAMPVVAKINAAHPLSPEARLSEERLLTLLSDDPKAIELVKAKAESRMALRALTCAKDANVGRLDTVATVKSLSLDGLCFQEQDAELQTFYGLRALGVLLAKPALRPFKAAGPVVALPKGKLNRILAGAFARDAGVGLLTDWEGNGVVVEIPGGMPIAQLPPFGANLDSSARLSPNGRVVMVSSGGQMEFIEAETGIRIWRYADAGRLRLQAWLPEVHGFVVADKEGQVMLADGLTGAIDVHPLSIPNSQVATHIPGQPARLLMGNQRELMLVEHVRTEQGIRASAVKQYRFEDGLGVVVRSPVPMQSGRMVVFASNRDIAWLDLKSGAHGTWRVSPMLRSAFTKLDESRIAVDAMDMNATTIKTWSLDITSGSVAPLDVADSDGVIFEIGDRVGMFRRGREASFGDVLTQGETQPLEPLVAEYDLQRQLNKLEAQVRRDSELSMIGRSDLAAPVAPTGALSPGLADVPADAQVHMVGVYEGKRAAAEPAGARGKRDVRVMLRPSSRPIVLVLSSYEPVNWILVNGGARLSAVLLSGYSDSAVTGIGSTRVLRIGTAYAYSTDSAEYARLRQTVTRYTSPREIRSFQGGYSGAEFSVGGS